MQMVVLIFSARGDNLPKTLEICPLELLGKGIQIKSTPFKRIEPLEKAIAREILPRTVKCLSVTGK